ncbi:MAG TPA: SDR family oxidoreductase [Chryseolinea sp.]|nr:SDR family oxidoreductase [Chryseolinea sp.]
MYLDLSGKRAIVCGSTQGIGKASAVELASMGASITLVARNEEKLKVVLNELDSSQGQKHDYITVDFSYPQELKKKVEEYLLSNTVEILINNTGGPPAGLAINAKPEDFVNAFSEHLLCNHILTQAVVPGMKGKKYGRIINIISTSVKIPIKGLGVSNSVRGAVANWSKTLANELGQFGITVNNVLPGATMTGRLEAVLNGKAAQTGKSFDELKGEMIEEIPMKRIAEAHEIAAAVGFLASPAAGYINGVNIPVDGGRTGAL